MTCPRSQRRGRGRAGVELMHSDRRAMLSAAALFLNVPLPLGLRYMSSPPPGTLTSCFCSHYLGSPPEPQLHFDGSSMIYLLREASPHPPCSFTASFTFYFLARTAGALLHVFVSVRLNFLSPRAHRGCVCVFPQCLALASCRTDIQEVIIE